MKRKKIQILCALIFSVTLLSGCFGGDDASEKSGGEGYHSYGTEEFRVDIPDAWEVLTAIDIPSTVPPNTLVAFRNNIRDPRFTAAVIIVKNDLNEEIESLDYAKALKQKLSTELVGYREINSEQMNMSVGGESSETLFLFSEGRSDAQSDLKRFMHKPGVKGKTAYMTVGAFLELEDEGVVQKVEKMVRSFEVK